ncbi:MAG: hypothetical protein J7J98_07510 [candidate division Zixibacteria bacterium]|nr:hypothetical protein [candidate division Zixibacteria bacterium]
MKKLLLGLFLLAALIAVSYLKMERDSEREAQAFIDGHDIGSRNAELAMIDVDSLEKLIDQKATEVIELRSAMTDTLVERDNFYTQTVDSLSAIIEAGQKEIASLEKQVASGGLEAKDSSSKIKVASKASHREILKHYKLAVAKLPADLSAYEYRVAVAEVRSDTATKFNITVVRLNEIRDANNLDY